MLLWPHGRPAPLGPGGFVMPTSHAWGACCPDRSPAAARPARPLAVRAASFARRVGSKPGQAPQASRRPPIGRGPVCCPARHHRRPRAPQTTGCRSRVLRSPNVVWLVVLGFWGSRLCVVTNVVNRRCFSCGLLDRCYKRRQSDGFFAENSGLSD